MYACEEEDKRKDKESIATFDHHLVRVNLAWITPSDSFELQLGGGREMTGKTGTKHEEKLPVLLPVVAWKDKTRRRQSKNLFVLIKSDLLRDFAAAFNLFEASFSSYVSVLVRSSNFVSPESNLQSVKISVCMVSNSTHHPPSPTHLALHTCIYRGRVLK